MCYSQYPHLCSTTMNYNLTAIPSPSSKEKKALRLMILIGIVSVVFFLYTMLQKDNIGYYPLYILLMITMVYYCIKYLLEWYHYFSIKSINKAVTDKLYTVDILTTYCAGEPFEMLAQTLTAIKNITYPHTAWCCDEADDENVKQLCLQLGVRHVTRTNKKDAKAGNINNALQYATGELCVVLDPDHIPAPEFLDQVVAYFDDPAIGYVQVVQAYYNQQQSLVAKGAAQQTYQFYGPMMMAMHSYGTVQAIGANCTFRRAALDAIGGHASGLAEDMHTSMQLHARGWRSVYLPAILTRGLVPATMSSYFKQQLKWSRGTWELLVTTYPKLFKKFTWRQRIHYFTLPFHYLFGFIFFINFLIPVISLFTGYVPLKMDVLNFLLAAFPVFTMSMLIRYYVQKWVAEDKERGFHLVGGILQIGTWWIYCVGIIYTVFRKKVPYIPTPKNDHEPLPLLLNLPNILIAVISLAAIVYGVRYDYNPYTIFMVVFASMQVFFVIFILSISGYTSNTSKINSIAMKLRQYTWLIEKSHSFLRKYSLPLSLVLIVAFIGGYYQQQKLPVFLPKPLPGLQVFYNGLYQQNNQPEDSVVHAVFSIAAKRKDIAIIAVDIPWGEGEKNTLDTNYLYQVYSHNALPLLVLQLWQKGNTANTAKDADVLQHIVIGKYDSLIQSFAKQVARLNKPVFFRFGNNPVNNKYALFSTFKESPPQFIKAWQYIHRLFDSAGADKMIWIWNAGEGAAAADYFPGNGFADWIGVNIAENNSKPGNSFDALYRPYHLLPLFKAGLPVMITKTPASPAGIPQWWNAAWKTMDTAFTEIKSVIAGDPDAPGKPANADLAVSINTILQNAPAGDMPLELPLIKNETSVASTKKYQLPKGIKSVGYNKGYLWFRNRHTLNLRTLRADITAMKSIGINTVERIMPGFYDNSLGKMLDENRMNLVPCFRILATTQVVNDYDQLQHQKEKILEVIKLNLDKKYIIAWNIGDDVLGSLASRTFLPDYFYYQQKYVSWLKDVCEQIRLLDTTRPIIMDLNWDENGRKRFKYYKAQVPQINTFMLVADTKYKEGLNEPLEEGMAWGKVGVDMWPMIPSIQQSGIIPRWQDIENVNYISLDGLLDMEGRKKQWYSLVKSTWTNAATTPSPVPDIKILKPAKIAGENADLIYQVIIKNNGVWKLYNDKIPGLRFEWYLVRTDQYGNTMFIKKAGDGPSLELIIPKEPKYYKLAVEAVMGDNVKMITATLNTPLE